MTTIDIREAVFEKFYGGREYKFPKRISVPILIDEISDFITELLEALAKEAIGELKNYQLGTDGFKNIEDISNSIGYNTHRREVISAFERRGIKI